MPCDTSVGRKTLPAWREDPPRELFRSGDGLLIGLIWSYRLISSYFQAIGGIMPPITCESR